MVSPPSSQISLPSSAQESGEEDDFLSLDFTKIAATPLPVVPVAQPQPESRRELTLEPLAPSKPLDSLPDLLEPPVSSLAQGSLEPFSLSFPVPEAVEPMRPVLADRASTEDFPVFRLDPVLEQVARAYAAGRVDEARKVLEDGMHDGQGLHQPTEIRWWMLFDIYRVMEDQEAFDRLSLEFAQQFEKSPPAWNGRLPLTQVTRAANTGGRASVAINGTLSAKSASQLEKLIEVARTRPALRIDVSKIQNANNGGCQLLLDVIHALKNSACELVFGGAEDLAGLIKGKLVVGQSVDEAMWLLLLELYQWMGLQDSFEEAAVDYAVTFEVSPPSWVIPKRKGSMMFSTSSPAASLKEDHTAAVSLSGELLGADPAVFSAIRSRLSHLKPGETMGVDLGRLRRIDEESAMLLRQTLVDFPHEPHSVHLMHCNHLVAALLDMAGMAELAVVTPSRI